MGMSRWRIKDERTYGHAAMTIQAYFRGHIFVPKGPLYLVKLYVRRVPRTATGSWRLAAIRASWFDTIQPPRAMM